MTNFFVLSSGVTWENLEITSSMLLKTKKKKKHKANQQTLTIRQQKHDNITSVYRNIARVCRQERT